MRRVALIAIGLLLLGCGPLKPPNAAPSPTPTPAANQPPGVIIVPSPNPDGGPPAPPPNVVVWAIVASRINVKNNTIDPLVREFTLFADIPNWPAVDDKFHGLPTTFDGQTRATFKEPFQYGLKYVPDLAQTFHVDLTVTTLGFEWQVGDRLSCRPYLVATKTPIGSLQWAIYTGTPITVSCPVEVVAGVPHGI